MPQVTLYIDEETDKRMRKAARAAGVSRSQWVAEAIRKKLGSDWPEGFLKLAWAWKDFPTAERLRENLGRDARREKI